MRVLNNQKFYRGSLCAPSIFLTLFREHGLVIIKLLLQLVKGIFKASVQFRKADEVEYGFAGGDEFIKAGELLEVEQVNNAQTPGVGVVVFRIKHSSAD
jgi:hypothetical protein